jgi:hypothetical protein
MTDFIASNKPEDERISALDTKDTKQLLNQRHTKTKKQQ